LVSGIKELPIKKQEFHLLSFLEELSYYLLRETKITSNTMSLLARSLLQVSRVSAQPQFRLATRAMASAYPILESSHNSEIRCAWYLLCVKAGDESVLPKVKEFLGEQARMKYIRPLYKALLASPKFKDTAVTTFETCKKKYHPISAKMCAMDLGLSHSKGD